MSDRQLECGKRQGLEVRTWGSTAHRQRAFRVIGTISTSGQDGVTGTRFTLTFDRTKNTGWNIRNEFSYMKHLAVQGSGLRVGKHMKWAKISQVTAWRVSRMQHRDGGARQSLAVFLSQDDRAGRTGRSRWAEFVLQKGELHRGFCWCAVDPAGLVTVWYLLQPWTIITTFSASFHGWKILARLQLSRSEPNTGPHHVTRASCHLSCEPLAAPTGFWPRACVSCFPSHLLLCFSSLCGLQGYRPCFEIGLCFKKIFYIISHCYFYLLFFTLTGKWWNNPHLFLPGYQHMICFLDMWFSCGFRDTPSPTSQAHPILFVQCSRDSPLAIVSHSVPLSQVPCHCHRRQPRRPQLACPFGAPNSRHSRSNPITFTQTCSSTYIT